MKIVISKNKDGNGYYTKLSNEYSNQKSEMYMSLQIDGFLTCYTGKDGQVKPKFVVTNAIPTTKYEKKQKVEQPIEQPIEENDPFEEFGESIDINDNFLE